MPYGSAFSRGNPLALNDGLMTNQAENPPLLLHPQNQSMVYHIMIDRHPSSPEKNLCCKRSKSVFVKVSELKLSQGFWTKLFRVSTIDFSVKQKFSIC